MTTSLPAVARRAIDAALEYTIVPSFSEIGPTVRSRLDHWQPLPSMADRNVVLTGGSGGIGRAIADQLVDLGATVVLTSRDAERATAVADEINGRGTDGEAIGMSIDTGDFDSVDAFAAAVIGRLGTIDVLIHNAGALTDTYRTGDHGLELTLASHLVGPYRLTMALRDHLVDGARVLWMSSGGMYSQGLDVDRLQMTPDDYKGAVAYARAKRAQVELVRHLASTWAPGVVMHSMHPGWVDTDGVTASLPGFATVMGPILRSVDQGADTMTWLAAGGADDDPPGGFYLDRRPRGTAYVPGTDTNPDERSRLLRWLQEVQHHG